jgi:hypothetical protein
MKDSNKMKIAIMQPYFFPYIGYFELIKSVDIFVFLNDVQFTKRGWINRNRIRSSHKENENIVIPVKSHKQKTNISEITTACSDWNTHIHKKIVCTYGIKNKIFLNYFLSLSGHEKLKDILCDSTIWTSRYLGLNTIFKHSENISKESGFKKLIEICKYFNCNHYVNACGGIDLYNREDFEKERVFLEFLEPTKFSNKLSIIDLILTQEEETKLWLNKS